MRIGLAHIRSLPGDMKANMEKHEKIIQEASCLQVDLIVFPELSITGYEPTLAKQLAVEATSNLFDPLQDLADANEMVISIGMPILVKEGVQIGMLIFKPMIPRLVYSKQLLHVDELPYFVPGNDMTLLHLDGKTVAFGICYVTLQRQHFEAAKEESADVYIASVAKPDRSTQKAYVHFPTLAKEFNTPILMCNCIGPCDDFVSNGKSSVWDGNGVLIAQLDGDNEGLLIYDTGTSSLVQ